MQIIDPDDNIVVLEDDAFYENDLEIVYQAQRLLNKFKRHENN